MGKPKFTEGPWEVNTTEDELWGDDVWYRVEYHSVIANDETIASDISSKANAALIAAAPEMARCLLDILGEIEFDEIPVKDRPASFKRVVETLGKAGIKVMEK